MGAVSPRRPHPMFYPTRIENESVAPRQEVYA
jgi:hypothetical protein